MLNISKIKDAISEKLYQAFGGEYEIYTNDIEQGTNAPCFLISLIEAKANKVIGERYFLDTAFAVYYLPKKMDNKEECISILDRLYEVLEYIEIDANKIRGLGMQGNISDGVLVFKVSYKTYLMNSKTKEDAMLSIKQN